MTINLAIDTMVDALFIQKDHIEFANVFATQYVIQYTPTCNTLGIRDRDSWSQVYYIMIWHHTSAMLSLSTYPFVYKLLAGRWEIMNSIICKAHELFNTKLITVCEPHHFYTPNDPKIYDIFDAVSIELKVDHITVRYENVPNKQALVNVTPTYEQMAVLL